MQCVRDCFRFAFWKQSRFFVFRDAKPKKKAVRKCHYRLFATVNQKPPVTAMGEETRKKTSRHNGVNLSPGYRGRTSRQDVTN